MPLWQPPQSSFSLGGRAAGQTLPYDLENFLLYAENFGAKESINYFFFGHKIKIFAGQAKGALRRLLLLQAPASLPRERCAPTAGGPFLPFVLLWRPSWPRVLSPEGGRRQRRHERGAALFWAPLAGSAKPHKEGAPKKDGVPLPKKHRRQRRLQAAPFGSTERRGGGSEYKNYQQVIILNTMLTSPPCAPTPSPKRAGPVAPLSHLKVRGPGCTRGSRAARRLCLASSIVS